MSTKPQPKIPTTRLGPVTFAFEKSTEQKPPETPPNALITDTGALLVDDQGNVLVWG